MFKVFVNGDNYNTVVSMWYSGNVEIKSKVFPVGEATKAQEYERKLEKAAVFMNSLLGKL